MCSPEAGPLTNILRLSRRVGPDSLYDYDLISVINHEGSLSQGHYTTYCREVDDVRLYFTSISPSYEFYADKRCLCYSDANSFFASTMTKFDELLYLKFSIQKHTF